MLHTSTPALDLRIFRSGRFNAAVGAGATFNFVTGGSTILFAFYLVAIRGESPELLGLLLIPATLLQAVAATVAGPAAARYSDRVVLITGLVLLLAGLLALTALDEQTSLAVVFVAVALNAVGGAIVQTPQSTIMMASAPDGLGGAVSAVKSAAGQAAYSLGPALFALVGTTMFVDDATRRLAGTNITLDEARAALRVAHGGEPGSVAGGQVLDPERARRVVEGAHESMLHAVHAIGLIIAVVPVVAIVAAAVLLRGRVANRG